MLKIPSLRLSSCPSTPMHLLRSSSQHLLRGRRLLFLRRHLQRALMAAQSQLLLGSLRRISNRIIYHTYQHSSYILRSQKDTPRIALRSSGCRRPPPGSQDNTLTSCRIMERACGKKEDILKLSMDTSTLCNKLLKMRLATRTERRWWFQMNSRLRCSTTTSRPRRPRLTRKLLNAECV
jgi:hypothetical protein